MALDMQKVYEEIANTATLISTIIVIYLSC